MKPESAELLRMADILPPPTVVGSAGPGLALTLLPVLCLAGIALWRYRSAPLRRLPRQLKKGRLTAREAAHQLATQPGLDAALQQRLDQLRFARPDPDSDTVLSLIHSARHGR